MTLTDLEFRHPWFLLAVSVAVIIGFLLIRNRGASVTYSSLVLPDAAHHSWRRRFAHLPDVMMALAAVAMAVALAGPRTPDDQTRIRSEGIAIMMVVDRSGSMNARDLVSDDIQVNRLDVVKRVFKQFVLGHDVDHDGMAVHAAGRGRPDDFVGLIAFARYADGLCPLTLDHGNLAAILDEISIVTHRTEDGTAIGEGLALAVEKLRRVDAKSKVIILLTDGVNNAGNITPLQAAELARQHDIKVHCIGAGSTGWAPVPAIDPFSGRQQFIRSRVEIDERTLKQIADICAGQCFRATDLESLAEIYKQIDRMERSEITELKYLRYHEWFDLPVFAAIALITLAAFSGSTVFRTLP